MPTRVGNGGGGGGGSPPAPPVIVGQIGALISMEKLGELLLVTGLKVTGLPHQKRATIELDINALQAEASPDKAADFVLIYDPAAAAHRKVLIDNLVSRVVDRGATDFEIVNDATEQSFFKATIPANALGTDKLARMEIVGDWLNNTGSSRTFTVKIKLNSTIVYQDVSRSSSSSSDRYPFLLRLLVGNQGATNVQTVGGLIMLGDRGQATVGIGDLADDEIRFNTPFNGIAGAEDSTAAMDIEVMIQHSNAHANLSLRRHYAIVEIL